jgi:hypothetical protein
MAGAIQNAKNKPIHTIYPSGSFNHPSKIGHQHKHPSNDPSTPSKHKAIQRHAEIKMVRANRKHHDEKMIRAILCNDIRIAINTVMPD